MTLATEARKVTTRVVAVTKTTAITIVPSTAQILLIVIIPAMTRIRVVVYRFYYRKYRIVSIAATRIVAVTMTTTFTTYVHQNMGSIHRHRDAPITITPRM